MCTVYTSSLYNHKYVGTLGLSLIDTTVKSGVQAFAPTWDIVTAHKCSDKSSEADQAYLAGYLPKMRESYKNAPDVWLDLLKQESVVLGCYCPSGVFCHRLVLVDILEAIAKKHDLPFSRGGEIPMTRTGK